LLGVAAHVMVGRAMNAATSRTRVGRRLGPIAVAIALAGLTAGAGVAGSAASLKPGGNALLAAELRPLPGHTDSGIVLLTEGRDGGSSLFGVWLRTSVRTRYDLSLSSRSCAQLRSDPKHPGYIAKGFASFTSDAQGSAIEVEHDETHLVGYDRLRRGLVRCDTAAQCQGLMEEEGIFYYARAPCGKPAARQALPVTLGPATASQTGNGIHVHAVQGTSTSAAREVRRARTLRLSVGGNDVACGSALFEATGAG
jgi:hypothetical protein